MHVTTPSQPLGNGVLPAELMVRGHNRRPGRFTEERMAEWLRPVTPTHGVSGLGDCSADDYSGCTPDEIQGLITADPTYLAMSQANQIDALQAQVDALAARPPAGYTGPRTVPGNATPPAAPPGTQWANVINSSGNLIL